MAGPAVAMRFPILSPGVSSLTSILNGEDDPHFPIPPPTSTDYNISTVLGDLNNLDDFMVTIIREEFNPIHSPMGIDSCDCVNDQPSDPPLPQHRPVPTSECDQTITPVPSTAIEATSWAAKNLTQPVAPTKPHRAVASRCPPVAEVLSAAVKKRLAKEKREAFSEDLTQAMEEHRDRLEEIASRHGKKFKDVLCIAGMAGRYKSQWVVSDIQAKILYQVKENNEGKWFVVYEILDCTDATDI